jgi:AraC-like DNA-binding protein
VATTEFAGNYMNLSFNVKMLFVFTPFLIFFNILFYKAIVDPYVIIQPDERPKYSGSALDAIDITNISAKLESHLQTKKPYLNQELKLCDLSNATGISERILSQVINQKWGQNFFSFINNYRVEEAKILLKKYDRKKSTMLGIAFDSGFNSKTAFYDAFKKHIGITPSEYRKQKDQKQ